MKMSVDSVKVADAPLTTSNLMQSVVQREGASPGVVEKASAFRPSEDKASYSLRYSFKPLKVKNMSINSRNCGFPLAQMVSPDVLFEILSWTLPEGPVDSGDLAENRVAPNNFAGVCCLWRCVALSSRRPWATMRLSHCEMIPFPWNIFGSSILKSGDAPLTLELNVTKANKPTADKFMTLVMSDDYRKRCKSVVIHVSDSWSRNPSQPTICEALLELKDMPMLETLRLDAPDLYGKMDVTGFPRLKDIVAPFSHSFGLYFTDHTALLPNLTTVDIVNSPSPHPSGYLSVAGCMTLLRIAPALETLKTEIHEDSDDFLTKVSNDPRVISFRLVHLSLYYYDDNVLASRALKILLCRLAVPMLQTLQIGTADGSSHYDHLKTTSLLRNSQA
ncbi:hypothetical protein DFH11DRAFT_1744965 [Phellopilus nigrolimitatus]|nr:hypothetical protein DFH11DRAFT_1744963 [Phellopilus nigrolimitatus]KAH8112357.1 hypothetical protein DFH11DRAFT_1744965 [Phellopilus nigrolimitatus]